MQYVVRFDRTTGSTGPDSVLITADHYTDSYREGQLVAFHFLDIDGEQIAMVRAEQVTYIALAGRAEEPVFHVDELEPPFRHDASGSPDAD